MNTHVTLEDEALRSYGYAPGNYTCRCHQDGCTTTDGIRHVVSDSQLGYFVGDKRAWRCRPCAIKARNYALSAPATRQVRVPQLVRDKMQPRDGVNEANELLKPAHAIPQLLLKCFLELNEVATDLTNPAEYGDVLESLISLAEANGVTEGQIRAARKSKNDAKGRLSNNFWTPDHFMEPKI